MSAPQSVVRDERTVVVENAAFRWGFYSFYLGLLVDCLYRNKVRHEDIGDLLVVLGVGATIVTVYLIRHKAAVPPLPWQKFFIVSTVVVFLVAFLLSLI
jgi:hypothetical protein